ncbi:uncharacterized protein EKO05_0011512 [Ascochyta rabiei]|uniref:Uncharacterized protein n=1 Tax=Didymella rabiei TaxID=5454 RepID=A0A163ALC3_DIDRA|nr:uncharacterized protein EKO05_0011512 [Ascochyta rabiei]KZM21252.1 hypothetical protein ST47_g7586 [Ascochyta rabiei]UPX21324.1 hypothetical protein EKO05_0011512 [Ascochyta rabiei]
MYATQIVLTLGYFLTTTLSYPDHNTPKWTSLAPIPIPRQEHTTLYLAPSTIVVLGGIIPTHDNSTIPVRTTSLMQSYSIPNNTWTAAPAFPRAMNHINAAVVKGELYVLGGLADHETPPAWRSASDSFVYSTHTQKWSGIPGLRTGEARGSAAVGVYKDQMILAGGMTDLELFENGTQASVAVVSIFDTTLKRWLDLPRRAKYMPEGRDHAGAAVVDGKMYVLGGRNQGQENVKDTVFVLDLCDLKSGWKVRRARMPTPRGGVAAGTVGTKVYLFGGEGDKSTESGVFDQVEVYDTVKDKWESVGKMRIPRHGAYAVGVGNRVYVPGGGVMQSGKPVADFDVFET